MLEFLTIILIILTALTFLLTVPIALESAIILIDRWKQKALHVSVTKEQASYQYTETDDV